jgi:hypothetical protein
VFENWVLRGVFGAKRDELRGEWRKLHNEELNGVYHSAHAYYCVDDEIEKIEMGGACSAFGREERRVQGFGGET